MFNKTFCVMLKTGFFLDDMTTGILGKLRSLLFFFAAGETVDIWKCFSCNKYVTERSGYSNFKCTFTPIVRMSSRNGMRSQLSAPLT